MGNPALKEGYGPMMQKALTPDRAKCRQLYQLFFCLLDAYVGYGEYNNLELYKNSKRQLMELLNA